MSPRSVGAKATTVIIIMCHCDLNKQMAEGTVPGHKKEEHAGKSCRLSQETRWAVTERPVTLSSSHVSWKPLALNPRVSFQLDMALELSNDQPLWSRCFPGGLDMGEWEVPAGSHQLHLWKRPEEEGGWDAPRPCSLGPLASVVRSGSFITCD